MDSYDIRFWDIKKTGNGIAARYRVRWAVNGREHCKSFKARPLADGFLTELKDAVRDRRPFDPRTGLPEAEVTEDEAVTWYAHARAYTEAKWGNLAPVSRRSVAEALVTVTIALSKKEPGAPDPKVLRQALFAWAFNPPPATSPRRPTSPPPSTGPNAPRSRSPTWKTPPLCGWRWPRAPRPWPASQRPGRPSGASGRCSTTPSATPSNSAASARTRSTGSSGPPPPSPRALTAGSSSAPPRPGRS
jgi:hypothetical protein